MAMCVAILVAPALPNCHRYCSDRAIHFPVYLAADCKDSDETWHWNGRSGSSDRIFPEKIAMHRPAPEKWAKSNLCC